MSGYDDREPLIDLLDDVELDEWAERTLNGDGDQQLAEFRQQETTALQEAGR